tara:strand:+ start:290 stop:574 length:285 start_codon:yes stop_codon:yes gene_type:complete
MLFFYHIYGSGKDPYCIECVRMLDTSGYEYALTFLDKSPELSKLVSKKYSVNKFPVVVECDINGNEESIGGYTELKAALEYKDECKTCDKEQTR